MIEVKNVTKKYGNFYAVRNISFEVKDGEIVGFLGRNGAGKSTTMNMITGFIEPTSGEIIVGGYNIETKPKKVKRQFGYMPEGTPLYSELTVKEFVEYMAELKLIPKKERKEAVAKAIRETGLEVVQRNLTKNLSRGYKQRVSLAGAIVGDPDILILDEPTVGLDPKQVNEIRNLIMSFRKDHTVFISSHILSEINQMCDKVIVIDKGEIIAVDTPDHLEESTRDTNKVMITVDDLNNKFEEICKNFREIESYTLVSENDDKTNTYELISGNQDIRKLLFNACAKEDVTILEMKVEKNSLEDAFIKLVENRPEMSQKEVEKAQYMKELDEIRQEMEEKKQNKSYKKEARKEARNRRKAERQAKKEAKTQEKKDKENNPISDKGGND